VIVKDSQHHLEIPMQTFKMQESLLVLSRCHHFHNTHLCLKCQICSSIDLLVMLVRIEIPSHFLVHYLILSKTNAVIIALCHILVSQLSILRFALATYE